MAEPPVKQEARNRVKADPDSSDQGGFGGSDNDNINQLASTSSVLELECKQRHFLSFMAKSIVLGSIAVC